MPTLSSDEQAVLDATKDLLVAIDSGDYATYEKLCSPSMTSFEGETKGHLAEGLAFHKYYFDMARNAPFQPERPPPARSNIAGAHVRLVGANAAVVAYTRLVQKGTQTIASQETRMLQRVNGTWQHCHFHRSAL